MSSMASNWGVGDVGCWLVEIGLGDLVQVFEGESIMNSYYRYVIMFFFFFFFR